MQIISRQEAISRGLIRYFTGDACVQGHVCALHINLGCYECRRVYARNYYLRNPTKFSGYQQRYRGTAASRVRRRTAGRRYAAFRRKTDPSYRLAHNLRKRVWDALKGQAKPASVISTLGASIDAVRTHIERMFAKGMSWDNYGREWQIDHIRPLSLFDLTDPIQFAEAGHYLNLRPLSSLRNLQKFNKRELLL